MSNDVTFRAAWAGNFAHVNPMENDRASIAADAEGSFVAEQPS